MSSQNYVVPPLSWDNIGQLSDAIRVQFSLADQATFPVMDFLELVLCQRMGMVDLRIKTQQEMGDFEGFTDPKGKFIILREDVYGNACNDSPRDRFTVAHELGHFFLHTGIPMARASDERRIKDYRLSEPQANQFAGELLMPRQFTSPFDTAEDVMQRHSVSRGAADIRLNFMRKKWINKKGI